jgi:hypothetical protein
MGFVANDPIKERDIEETEEQLEFEEPSPFEFWKDKQRELVTSVVDYNLGALTDLVNKKVIDLSPKYQRRFRWSPERQSKLIESFLMNVPVPPIFLNEDEYGQYSVIDGKQRLTAVADFFKGKLKLTNLEVFQDLNDTTFDDMPPQFRRVLETRPNMRAVIILRQSDPDIKFEVFRRLNTGGVKLNAQEVRNSAFPGPLNDLILELSEDSEFHSLLGIRSRTRSAIWQEMRDAEFVLRYLTFRGSWQEFSGGMRSQMDEFMEEHKTLPAGWIEEARTDFKATLRVVGAAFGEHAFHRWEPSKQRWRKQVLASLFDAEMFAARGLSPEPLKAKRAEIEDQLKALFSDTGFRASIDAATNTPSFFRERIATIRQMLVALTA